MERIEVARLMERQGMVPLFFHADVEVSKRLLVAIYAGGGRLLEFTHRGPFAQEVFAELSKMKREKYPDLALGIGSVTDAGLASMYMAMGADFVVTPSWREDVVRVCNRRKVLCAPGCGSLTEIGLAEEWGCEIVKLFPGGIYGPGFVRAVRGPQPWTKIMPTGGVSPNRENLESWFAAGSVCVGMGSKLVSKDIIQRAAYGELTKAVEEALAMIGDIRGK